MKYCIAFRNLLISAICVMSTGLSAATDAAYLKFEMNDVKEEYLSTIGIDSLDTIYFDLRNLNIAGSLVEMPVYFRSDDSVYAMDFSFMYNNQLFNFDSITSVQSNFQYLFNYAPFDSTVYFTSYSLGLAYQNNTNVVKTRFNLMGSLQSLTTQDIHHALGYLNGDVCPVKIIPPSLTGVQEEHLLTFDMFPNPANSVLNIISPEDCIISISDLAGNLVMDPLTVIAAQPLQLNIAGLSSGVYMVSLDTVKGHYGKSRLIVTE